MRLRWWRPFLIVAIVLLALALRLWAIGWGLPYTDHPDEPVVAGFALGMLRHGDWNPHFFEYPSLYLYALRLAFSAHWAYGFATHLYNDLAQLPQPRAGCFLSAPGFFLWGRALTATLGGATVALLYAVGRRWWGASVGLAAAAVLAVLPFHIRHSQYLTVDVAGALLTLLALGAALRLRERGDRWSYALAGLAAGIAASTKYNDGSVVLALGAAHACHWGRASLGQLGRLRWATLGALLGFVAFTPYAVLTPWRFFHGISVQYHDYQGGWHGDLIGRWPIAGYVRFFWTIGLGPLPALAAALGIGVVIARRDRAGLVLLAFVLPYVLFFLAWPQHFWRNLLPIIPPLTLCAGIGIRAAAARIAQIQLGARQPRVPSVIIAPALTALIIALPLFNAIQLDRLDIQTDSRLRAAAYIRDQLPRGAQIAVELDPQQWAGDRAVLPVPYLTDHTIAWYRAHDIRYLVANGRYRNRANQPAYDQLRAQATTIRVFDDRPAENQLGAMTGLSRSFASRHTRAWIEVLDLGANPPLRALPIGSGQARALRIPTLLPDDSTKDEDARSIVRRALRSLDRRTRATAASIAQRSDYIRMRSVGMPVLRRPDSRFNPHGKRS